MEKYFQVRDSSAWTAFLWACYVGSTEIAEILLSAGADVNTKGLHNCTGQITEGSINHRLGLDLSDWERKSCD